MRLKLGRPDISRYARMFDVPQASSPSDLAVTWLGVSTILIEDGKNAFLVDGFFSRPSLLKVGVGKLRPNHKRIDAVLNRLGVETLDAVVPVHSHYDHVMDSAEVAIRTGARVIGGESTVNVARGGGIPEARIVLVQDRQTIEIAGGSLSFFESEHCPPDRYPGTIDTPLVPPVPTRAYSCGEAWSFIYRHESGKSVLIQGSAGYRPSALEGQAADVVYLGIGQLGLMPADYIAEYWREMVTVVGAKHVVLTHWDDFFRSLDAPLRALPYVGDDLDVTVHAFRKFAQDDGVTLHFPTVWQREDPWAINS